MHDTMKQLYWVFCSPAAEVTIIEQHFPTYKVFWKEHGYAAKDTRGYGMEVNLRKHTGGRFPVF